MPPLHHPRSGAFSPARARGSVLIVALMFSIIIGASLVFFLRVSNNATRLSYSTYHLGVAMNIAESGLEQAVWEMRRESGAWAPPWTPAPGGTGAYQRTFDLGKIDGGSTTVVKVYAQPGSNAYAIARAIVTPPPPARTIEKWVKVTLSKEGRIKVGGLGRKGIVASGNNVVMASWNSDPDKDPTTPFVPFSAGVMRDKMSLATLDLDASLDSGQADVNGKAAVGGSSLGAIKVGPNGYIGPFGTPSGTKDPGSISTNFSTDLPIVTAPDKSYTHLGAISSGVTKLPRGTTTKDGGPSGTPSDTADDGVYYYQASQVTSSIEVTPGYKVVLLVDNNPAGSISLGGSSYIKVGGQIITNTITGSQTQSSGELKIYTSGDVKFSGQSTAVNEIATVNHTPAASYTTETTISTVSPIKGQGKYKNDVIGWTYTQSTQTTYTLDGEVYTLPPTEPTTYTRLKTSDPTEPVVGKTSTTGDASEASKQTGALVGQPVALQIYGTRTETERKEFGPQDITISGNGSLSAILYAPNGAISAKGGGNSGFMMGSLVGYTLKFTGNDCFYYDESLADADEGSRLAIDEWDEIVAYADPKNAETFAKMNF